MLGRRCETRRPVPEQSRTAVTRSSGHGSSDSGGQTLRPIILNGNPTRNWAPPPGLEAPRTRPLCSLSDCRYFSPSKTIKPDLSADHPARHSGSLPRAQQGRQLAEIARRRSPTSHRGEAAKSPGETPQRRTGCRGSREERQQLSRSREVLQRVHFRNAAGGGCRLFQASGPRFRRYLDETSRLCRLQAPGTSTQGRDGPRNRKQSMSPAVARCTHGRSHGGYFCFSPGAARRAALARKEATGGRSGVFGADVQATRARPARGATDSA